MMKNVSGTSNDASGYPSASRRIAKSDATAAATIPLGPIHEINIFSLGFRSEVNVDYNTSQFS